MGEHARTVQERLADDLRERLPDAEWTIERRVAGTPVDVVGETADRLVLVELEWRRADPADNAAKLFRHVAGGVLDDAGPSEGDTGQPAAVVVQVFTAYYDLASGGVSSKRENAEFVGAVAAEQIDRLDYTSVALDVDPPRRDGDLPGDWRASVAEAADAIARVPTERTRHGRSEPGRE